MDSPKFTQNYKKKKYQQKINKTVTQEIELKSFWENLLFIVKIIFDLEIKSKAGKDFTNKKKKKFGIGLSEFGLGNASA